MPQNKEHDCCAYCGNKILRVNDIASVFCCTVCETLFARDQRNQDEWRECAKCGKKLGKGVEYYLRDQKTYGGCCVLTID